MMYRQRITGLSLLLTLTMSAYGAGDSGCRLTSKNQAKNDFNLSNASCLLNYSDKTSKLDALEDFLKRDQTDEREYIKFAKGNKDRWFVCKHFSSQFFLRSSCLSKVSAFSLYQTKTDIDVFRPELQENQGTLPILTVTISSSEAKYYHAVNAIFLGDSLSELRNIDSYAFIEPQTDEIFHSIAQIQRHYSEKYSLDKVKDLNVAIGIIEDPGLTSKGDVQFRTKVIAKFLCPALE